MASTRGHSTLSDMMNPQHGRILPNDTDGIITHIPNIRHHHGQPMASHYVVGDEHTLDFDRRNSTKASVFWTAMSELFNLSSSAMASVADGGQSILMTNNTTDKAPGATDWSEIIAIGILAVITLATIVGMSASSYQPNVTSILVGPAC